MSSCQKKESQIYKLEQLSYSEEVKVNVFNGQELHFLSDEVFIIRYYPKQKENLFNLIKNFNDSTLNFKNMELKSQDYDKTIYMRTFYRETKELNRNTNFPKKGYFPKKDISHFYKDKLIHCTWIKYHKGGNWINTYWVYLESLIGEEIDVPIND